MRFILTDNHIVRCEDICEDIKDYKEINTGSLFPGGSFGLSEDYDSYFMKIKDFIQQWNGEHEIFTSTLFYLIPGFITELMDYLGPTVNVMPVFSLIGSSKVREIYDNYIVETIKNNDGSFSITWNKYNVLASLNGKGKAIILKGSGIPAVVEFNKEIKEKMQFPSAEFLKLYLQDWSYEDLLVEKQGYALFSPYSSLVFAKELIDNTVSIKSLCNTAPSQSTEFTYRLSTTPETKIFSDSWQSWIYAEKSNSFSIQKFANNKSINTLTFSIPENIVKESEMQVDDLHFGKFFMKLVGDFFGQLHIKVQSLSKKTYYAII